MEFQLPIQISSLPNPIQYQEKIMLMGSCFTEHIGNALRDWKFDTLQNPNGILFDPASVASSLVSYIHNRPYQPEDLVYFNELWQSWQFHSQFANMDKEAALEVMNVSQARGHAFLKNAKWLIITLGSAFSYRLLPDAPEQYRPGPKNFSQLTSAEAGTVSLSPTATSAAIPTSSGSQFPTGTPYTVANCHRAPGQIFRKHLMTIEEINTALDNFLYQLFQFNANIQVIFTVSPVRHVRDGVIENNRSKARLIESVHHLVNKFSRLYYFPAYELVIDVLRDYRFYDVDLVHPNYAATNFVLDKFIRHCIDAEAQTLLEEVKKINIARRHKPFQPSTQAHRRFLEDYKQRTAALSRQYPFLDLQEELTYFST